MHGLRITSSAQTKKIGMLEATDMPYRRVKHHLFRHCRSRVFALSHMYSQHACCTLHGSTVHTVVSSCAVVLAFTVHELHTPCCMSVARPCALLRHSDSLRGSLYMNCSASGVQYTVHDTQCTPTVVCRWNVLGRNVRIR